MASNRPTIYRLLGHERVALTPEDVARLVRGGLLGLDTKIAGDGEHFATAISASGVSTSTRCAPYATIRLQGPCLGRRKPLCAFDTP